jgi:hypothetical protein
MQIKHILGITTLAFGCHAGAAVVDWGAHASLEQSVGAVQPGSFTDIINFSVGFDTPLAVSIVATNLSPKLQIIGGTLSLYERTAEGLTLEIGTHDFGGSSGDSVHLFDLDPGDYLYAIKGFSTGSEGGWYTVASSTLAVPEPGPAILALCGFMLLGAIYKRPSRR